MSITPMYINRKVTDHERRTRIFTGALFLYSAPPESARLVEWARKLIAETFTGMPDVRRPHLKLPVDQFAKTAGTLKSRFTNDPHTRRLCQELIVAMGCAPDRTYFDLPRLRVAPPGDYLTTGVSYSYKAHRDTWYAHPKQLINYWVPVHDSEPSTVMSMFVNYFNRPVANSSGDWSYDEWVKKARHAATENIRVESRPHPVPIEDLTDAAELRIVQNAGDLMLFSTCQLHASAPNRTEDIRYSYDLRTLNIDDLREDRGPNNIDAAASGSTLKDFLRVSDLAPLKEEITVV
jgi:hypothetical protein